MRKSEIYDRCVAELQKALSSGKFGRARYKSSGVALSVTETKEGLVSRAWGFLFDDPDRTARCTEVHVSYYGESVALERLLKEVTTK
jgi:hypothetical protein